MTLDSRIGLVLEGGGMRGVFTSGVLDFMLLVMGTKPDLAYILVFRRYFLRHFGRRTGC